MPRLSILHVVASLNIETGGPAQSVPALADAQAASGLDVTVLTLDYRRHGTLNLPKTAKTEVIEAGPLARWMRGWSPKFRNRLMELSSRHDLVHSHGMWMQVNRFARMAALTHGKPLVVSPRGMLEPYSLGRSAFRKRLAWIAFERSNLFCASAMHATSHAESQSIRAAIPDARIVVIPNVAEQVPIGQRTVEKEVPGRILYLGRLDQKKGLDWLVNAWLTLGDRTRGWRLQITGPCSMGFERDLEALREQSAGCSSIFWTPPVQGDAKHALIASSQALILPSRSENFGNVVLEALGHGVPVIATKATPWQTLEEAAAGWWVDTSEEGVRSGIESAIAISDTERRTLALNARSLASRFSGSAIASAWASTYQSLLERDT